jgi:hypothetical protein
VCYHTRMPNSTTNEETPRPEPRCPSCGSSEDAPNTYDLCENCVDALDSEYAPEDPGIDGDRPTGYEADDERPYGWDVPEEEYPDW